MRKFLMLKRARCSAILVIFPTVRGFKLKALRLPKITGRENTPRPGSPRGFNRGPWESPGLFKYPIADFLCCNLEFFSISRGVFYSATIEKLLQ